MPIVESRFRPAWWLPGPHLQTLGPVLARPTPRLEFDWERIELDDGDFIDLAWARPRAGRPDAPTLTILPGLGGNYLSKYARGLALDALARGWSAGILHFRGTSRETNRLAKTYHAGLTSDPRQVLEHVRRTRPSAPIGAVGLSLGGSVLLNLLAEDGAGSPITAAAAASVPLDLAACARRIQRGFSRVYDRHLARELTSRLMARRPLVEKRLGPVDPRRLTSVESFDELVTAPLHGFVDAADYYQRCSSGPRLGALKTPTIIVQALDDPFLVPEMIPSEPEIADAVTVEVATSGGHVGFVGGPFPGRADYWLERRLIDFLALHLEPPSGKKKPPSPKT